MRDVLFLLLGLAVLTYAADRFVIGAVRVATILKVSTVLVGALVVGFGTSAPELLVSALASIDGKQDIALGNIVGSNTANVLMVVGAAAIFSSLPIAQRIWRQEIRLMLASVALLALVCADRRVTTVEAIGLLVAAVAAIGLIIFWASRDRAAAADLEDEIEDLVGGEHALGPSVILTLFGLAGTLGGAQLLVVGASGLAATLGMSEAVIGLTIVAIGTSLPELVTATAAARHDENDLIIGNIVGSNIFNSLPVAGIAGLLDTTTLDPQFSISLVVMVAASLLFAVFARRSFHITRNEGIVLLVAFVVAMAVTF
ncbi:MAG: calcium/sodium antiporter [Euzebya sp.]